MKKLMVLLLAMLLLTGCGAESEDTETTAQPTQPKLKTVWVHSSITRTDSTATAAYRTEYVYRDNDTLSEVVIYNDTDDEVQHYRVNCDENGNPTDWIATGADENSSIRYSFDQQGRPLGTYAYTNGVLMTSTEYTWSGDLRVSVTVKVSSQSYEQRTEYTYDDKNRLIRQDQYEDGQLSTYAICTCDEQGRLLKSQSYDLQGNAAATITCSYEGTTETRVTANADGTVLQTQVLTYDEYHNLLKNTLIDGTGTLLFMEEHTWKAVEVPVDSPRASV